MKQPIIEILLGVNPQDIHTLENYEEENQIISELLKEQMPKIWEVI